jgi:hypothetical protein
MLGKRSPALPRFSETLGLSRLTFAVGWHCWGCIVADWLEYLIRSALWFAVLLDAAIWLVIAILLRRRARAK